MNLTKDLKDILRAFNANAVTYMIVGGHAFGVHAEPRTTKDLDLFIRSDPQNAQAVFQALAQFGAPIAGMSPKDFADGTTFQMGQSPERIDVLQRIDGVSFDEAWAEPHRRRRRRHPRLYHLSRRHDSKQTRRRAVAGSRRR